MTTLLHKTCSVKVSSKGVKNSQKSVYVVYEWPFLLQLPKLNPIEKAASCRILNLANLLMGSSIYFVHYITGPDGFTAQFFCVV